ncbi:SLC13 family permease [Antrihabitans sp. NCIMB 15449]|uniref:SLC13 family permease n=1 Tax=Antrihabitans spumae TaxID=3373370 RepID=A0ABW7JPT6_9NOCA
MLSAVWAVLAVAGAVVIATGWLPGSAAEEIAIDRGGPVLAFLVAATVLAELADRAGVFDVAAAACARAARGSIFRLFLLVAVLAVATTVVMGIDTTAVLLTPVVLALTLRLGVRPWPFALLVLWLANTSSLLLPVSNLTNLLAQQREMLHAVEFARRMALPQLAAVVITVVFLAALYRRDLVGRYDIPDRTDPPDRWTYRLCAISCAALAPAVLVGIAPAVAASVCALATVVVFAVRDRAGLEWSLIPWRLVVLTEGLFLVVGALSRHGLTDLLARLAGDSPWLASIVGAGAANLVNNLPAYLAIEQAIAPGETTQLFAALVGTNTGPLITVWASLATLLWRERCLARGVEVPIGKLALVGICGAPLVVLGATAALLITV